MATALIERVGGIYDLIDERQRACANQAGRCRTCGRCCDFKTHDHRLYVTPPEIEYLAHHIGAENIKPMTEGICPYNEKGKCTVYDYRFSGCRIFCCNGDRDFQSQLSESVLRDLKKLCTDFNLPYHYKELADLLKQAAVG